MKNAFLPLLFSFLVGCAAVTDSLDRSAGPDTAPTVTLAGLPGKAEIPSETKQLLVVTSHLLTPFGATVVALEKAGFGWRQVFPSLPAVVGRNGFATIGDKREGDGKTPTGIFPLELAFGYGADSPTRMPYRQVAADDIWIDDVNAPDYNRWVKRGQTSAISFEEMRRADDLYRYGLVIGYNNTPVVPGHGSAIFFHVWRGADKPSAGCVAMAEPDLLELLRWLDPAKEPLTVLGSASIQDRQ